ncbi:MAG: hypothetical protein Q4D14_00470 [Bacteroidales bacterium]|nr:hypothetical protein [Bacteroidales bacterium]
MKIDSRKHKIVVVLCLFLALITTTLSAQTYRKYRMEVGVLGGGSFSLGDVNHIPFAHLEPTLGAFLKYKFNGHWEIKFEGTGWKSGVGMVNNTYKATPFGQGAIMGEYNFYNYGGSPYEDYPSNVTPYVFWGLGLMVFEGGVAASMPFGLGVKWRIGKRFNLGAYWSMQKLSSDKFDGVDNPDHLNGTFLMNRDWNSTVAVYLSIDFWKICAPCHNYNYYKSKHGFSQYQY